MITKLIITSAVVATSIFSMCINGGPISPPDRPADEGEMKREKADKIMCQTYGENWFGILVANERSNPSLSKAMAAAYERAIGYHQPANRQSSPRGNPFSGPTRRSLVDEKSRQYE